MTVLPRAATSPELSLLRSDNQAVRLYLTFFTPATVYTASLAAVPSSTDSVTSITYSGGSGTLANVLTDMTLLVGTTPGAYDQGIARIRKDGTTLAGTFYIGEESEINWQPGANLTVLDEFLLWPRHPRVVGTTEYMDWDIAYSDQHSKCDSIPVLGPDRVAWLDNATVTLIFDGSQSWALNNTITAYQWYAPGASATSGMTTATPSITYNAVGTYRVGLQITNSDGAVFTGYRRVFVVTEASGVVTTFQLKSCQGSYSSGGWSFQVAMEENATLPTLRDRMQVILHAREQYGTTQTSIGYVAGSENVIAIGWIDQESIQWQREDLPGVVTFTVDGPQYWLNRMSAFPVGLKDKNVAPVKWTRFQGLTAKAITWHLLHWRTTATRCIDVYPCTNQSRASRLDAPGGQTIWQQLVTILENSIIARPVCDRYSRLFMQVEQNLLSTTARSAIPSVMTLLTSDWTNEVDFDRRIVSDVSYVDLSGVTWDGYTPTAFFALSPGHVFRHYGQVDVRERLVLFDQATTNTLCGAYWGWKNNPYPRMAFNLASNNRLIDLAPYQYLTVNIAAANTPRGFTASSLRLIPRGIKINWNDRAFALTTDVEVEAETEIGLSVTGDVPPSPPAPPPPPPPPPIPPPPQPIITLDAKYLWIVHDNPSATPPLAVLYTDVSNILTGSYTALTPPGGLNIDQLRAALYVPSTDKLMVIGHATATPPGPGWGGGAANCVFLVTTPTTSPTWSLLLHDGDFGSPSGNLNLLVDQYAELVLKRQGIMVLAGSIAGGNYMVSLATSAIFPGGSYYLVTGSISHPGGTPRALYISPFQPFYPTGYGQNQIYYHNDFVGPLPDDLYLGKSTYLSDPSYGTTYNYSLYGVEAGNGLTYLYTVRRKIADGTNEVIRLPVFFSGYPNGDPAPFVSVKALDEIDLGGLRDVWWTNTLNPSNNVMLNFELSNTGYLYYYLDSLGWGKASGTVPRGFAHFANSGGGKKFLFVNDSNVTTGNVPAKYTDDVTDLTNNPWIDLTRNMWSLITGSDLIIRHSHLSF